MPVYPTTTAEPVGTGQSAGGGDAVAVGRFKPERRNRFQHIWTVLAIAGLVAVAFSTALLIGVKIYFTGSGTAHLEMTAPRDEAQADPEDRPS